MLGQGAAQRIINSFGDKERDTPANGALAGGFLSKREVRAFPLTPSAGLLRHRRRNQVCLRLGRSKTSGVIIVAPTHGREKKTLSAGEGSKGIAADYFSGLAGFFALA